MQQRGLMPRSSRLRLQVNPLTPAVSEELGPCLTLTCICRLTCWASRSGTPFGPGPGPQLHLHPVSGGLDVTGTVAHGPLHCFAAHVSPTGVSAVTSGFLRCSTTAAASSWSGGPDSCDGTSDPEPQPSECFGAPGAAAALPDGLNGDASHSLSTGTPGPHPHRQGPRCVPPHHPKPASASVTPPLWTSGWCPPDTASVRCCSIAATFLHPGRRSGLECHHSIELPGVARHVSEHRP